MGRVAIGIERSEAPPIEILLIGIGAGQREVDVIEHATIARARLARRAGHEPLGEGRDRGGILGVEERAEPAAVRMCVVGGRLLFSVFVVLGIGLGHQRRARCGPGDCGADQECAASFVMFAHACFLHVEGHRIAMSHRVSTGTVLGRSFGTLIPKARLFENRETNQD